MLAQGFHGVKFKILTVTILSLLGGCITPNLLGETARPHLGPSDFGPTAEAVELRVTKGERLRGVFVGAGRNAPVVLHLLGGGETLTARGEVAGKAVWVGDTIRDLLSLGFSSLVLDYRGVGRSDGNRHSRQIPVDVRAAWKEAVRRARGDPRQVLIRATSLGTLAAASLIEEGAVPGAAILIGPVRSETVATHWLRTHRSPLIAYLSRFVLRRALAVDQELALQLMGKRQLVVFGIRDELLPGKERAPLVAAACAAGATVVERDQDHLTLMRDARRLLPEEQAFFASLKQTVQTRPMSLRQQVCHGK